jgi:hypothetical protein
MTVSPLLWAENCVPGLPMETLHPYCINDLCINPRYPDPDQRKVNGHLHVVYSDDLNS